MRAILIGLVLLAACGAEPIDSGASGLTSMDWTFTNNCFYPMKVRLFDRETPLGDFRVLTERTETFRVNCTDGAQVSFGAATEGWPGELGAGLDGSKSCTTECAFICGHDLGPRLTLECP